MVLAIQILTQCCRLEDRVTFSWQASCSNLYTKRIASLNFKQWNSIQTKEEFPNGDENVPQTNTRVRSGSSHRYVDDTPSYRRWQRDSLRLHRRLTVERSMHRYRRAAGSIPSRDLKLHFSLLFLVRSIDILYILDSASLLVKLKPRIFQRLHPFE
jgi:hypothetical protein